MVTYTYYVIVALTAVCLAAAWPQQRSRPWQSTNNQESRVVDDTDGVVWMDRDQLIIKTLSTPPNSPNIPRQSVAKTSTKRAQRLQSGLQTAQSGTVEIRQVRANQSGPSENLGVPGGSRAPSSQQEAPRPMFTPRAHQQHGNRSTGQQVGHGGGGRTAGVVTNGARNGANNVSRGVEPESRAMMPGRTNSSRDDSEVAASQDAATRGDSPSGRYVTFSTEHNLPRWSSNKQQHTTGTRIKATGDIVFPGSREPVTVIPRRFTPRVDGDRPRCAAADDTFCLNDTSNEYPIDYLNRILEEKSIVFQNYFATDELREKDHITQRIDGTPDDHPLCSSMEEVVFPKAAQNKDDEWLFIVNLNQDEYRQGVRIEKCRRPEQECAYSEGFPLSVKTFCKQKYIYRQMLALTQDGQPKADSFKLPSCCSCHTVSIGDVGSRMAVDPTRQTPAPKRKKRRS